MAFNRFLSISTHDSGYLNGNDTSFRKKSPPKKLRGKSIIEYIRAGGLFLPNPTRNSIEPGEFAHLHSNDGSFHMILHLSDAKLLIDNQWSENFPYVDKKILNKTIVSETFFINLCSTK
ncbi:unnamed protein product [Rotaria magnacalcarata]|uniref:Luciferase domain-containing protein n=1 Tax=Rotaria magnacalcarata TaxID=392030 RepID=A0A816P6G1_9BILA|nr:unnamed protein product [Rotaria magnacalcarata]CAF4091302.1 unnamed protein product [Rotaria magnacalcarata]